MSKYEVMTEEQYEKVVLSLLKDSPGIEQEELERQVDLIWKHVREVRLNAALLKLFDEGRIRISVKDGVIVYTGSGQDLVLARQIINALDEQTVGFRRVR